jgi:chemotaxis protein methyltransferase CheR
MRSSGFTDPSFARLAELAHLLAGLVFPPNRQPSAEAGMRRAMAALRISDPAALLRATEAPGEARDVVLAELTVGESYFFRDAAQLDLLATEILPSRLESHGANRPLRVWSAGCASGEEPYTIAILLHELGWPHPARILGTDIAIARLDAARRARYTRWALRGVSDERVAKWFDRSGNYFDLRRSMRESVEFRSLNLVRDEYSSNHSGFDLVLCRNVMIYFDLPTVAHIATGLLDSLHTDGWLVLGASDPPLAHLVPCELVMTSAGAAYRRVDATRKTTPLVAFGTTPLTRPEPFDFAQGRLREAPALETFVEPKPVVVHVAKLRVAPTNLSPIAAIQRAYDQADYPAAESMAIVELAASAELPDHEQDTLRLWILHIRAVANQGRLHEAGALCARALETHPLAAELHYLHATLLVEAGWYGDAAIAARRSIYLDRTFVMGHLLLGDTLARTGHANGARIAFENVVALLADADAAAPIAAADGVPASRLRQVAALRLRELPPEVR